MSVRRTLTVALLVLLAGCSGLLVDDGIEAPSPTIGSPTGTPDPSISGSPTASSPGEPRTEWTVTVVRVIDGDTYEVEFRNGNREDVRLLGIDTPEVRATNDPAEFDDIPETEAGHAWLRDWGHKASEFARTRLLGEQVAIRTDLEADRRGGFGRLLVYVIHDGEDFNRALIDQGYARLYDTTFSRRDAYAGAEASARTNGVGLWGFEGRAPATATAVADGGGPLALVTVYADAAGDDNANPNDEYLLFENVADGSLDLSGWTVRDAAGHTYRVPAGFTLEPGARVTLYTGIGTDTASELYWGADGAIWNNGGDTVTVTTESGERVLVQSYP